MPRIIRSSEYSTIAPIPKVSEGADPQDKSPLFSTFPAEIRQRIYTYTLQSFHDPVKPFNPQHHHYRPGHEARQKYDFRLLQTCKRIYHEARLLPISLNEITIYLYRGPRSNLPLYSQYDWRTRYRILSRDQHEAVQTVHFFAQQCYLESTPNLLSRPNDVHVHPLELRKWDPLRDSVMVTRKIILTLRRSDWWSWESPPMSNDQLGICPWRAGRTDWKQMEAEPLEGPQGEWHGWGDQFQHVQGLDTLEIEFETISTKKKQLERVVGRAKQWKFPLKDDKVLAWTGEVKESAWEGLRSLEDDNGDRAVQLRSVREGCVDIKPLTCTNVVMTMRWRKAQREQPKE